MIKGVLIFLFGIIAGGMMLHMMGYVNLIPLVEGEYKEPHFEPSRLVPVYNTVKNQVSQLVNTEVIIESDYPEFNKSLAETYAFEEHHVWKVVIDPRYNCFGTRNDCIGGEYSTDGIIYVYNTDQHEIDNTMCHELRHAYEWHATGYLHPEHDEYHFDPNSSWERWMCYKTNYEVEPNGV